MEKFLHPDYKKIGARLKSAKSKMRTEFKKNKEVAVELGHNAQQALHDLQSGKIFTDDEAAKNLKNTLMDSVKAAGMTGIFLLPGGSVGLIALRKLLKSKEAKKIGIENLLTLTVEESENVKAEKEEKNEKEAETK
ncbi:MAG: hypothetical protein ACOZCO_00180 [Bacteroidota bacterium]